LVHHPSSAWDSLALKVLQELENDPLAAK